MEVVVDCRKFYQPPPGTGHVGTYDKDVELFVESKHFEPWLKVVKEETEKIEKHVYYNGG